ncbi:MAG: EVE domain-containing protein [Acidobacteria bacterium]|nr:EVE domain-containing protein [Acidobacteriota bacterium]
MNYFLAKTEAAAYSIDDLAREGRTAWSGVRNAQAVRALNQMRPGDTVLIYHSTGESSVVGVAKVVSDPRPDPDDPKSAIVDFEFLSRLSEPVTLQTIKQSGLFADFALVRQSRLSTMPVPEDFMAWLREQRPELKKLK